MRSARAGVSAADVGGLAVAGAPAPGAKGEHGEDAVALAAPRRTLFCFGGRGRRRPTDRSGRPEMMEEGAPDLRELVRLPDVLVVCSSTGWTDEKHMLYLRLLEETFVHQLHGSGCIFKGLFNCSPRYCRQMKSSKQIVKYTTPGQQGCAIVEGGKVKSCIKAEHVESPSCCGNQQDEKVRSLEDNASTTKPMEKATSHARAASPGQASTCYVGKHRHSPSRSADYEHQIFIGIKFIYLSDVARFLKENYSCIYSEGSDQNFDEETQGTGESKHEYNPKRLKSADGTRDHQVVNAEAHQVGCLDVSDKNSENFSASSKVLAASLDVEAGSPSGDCKDHGPKG
ncbi:hypothetical protein Zm00014a_035564 [Zea mays]|uniref:Uncharacterized protein n=1 Tax=Zea mays TaxID=4577 RepID=A0A3L6FXP4_MAIZE|nr:hypothetical protein Zm00014a_035564 [Zea mays]